MLKYVISGLFLLIVLIFSIYILFFSSRKIFYIPNTEYTITYGSHFDYSHILTTYIVNIQHKKEENIIRIKDSINRNNEVITDKNTVYFLVNKNNISSAVLNNLHTGSEINLIWEGRNNSIYAKKIYIYNDL